MATQTNTGDFVFVYIAFRVCNWFFFDENVCSVCFWVYLPDNPKNEKLDFGRESKEIGRESGRENGNFG